MAKYRKRSFRRRSFTRKSRSQKRASKRKSLRKSLRRKQTPRRVSKRRKTMKRQRGGSSDPTSGEDPQLQIVATQLLQDSTITEERAVQLLTSTMQNDNPTTRLQYLQNIVDIFKQGEGICLPRYLLSEIRRICGKILEESDEEEDEEIRASIQELLKLTESEQPAPLLAVPFEPLQGGPLMPGVTDVQLANEIDRMDEQLTSEIESLNAGANTASSEASRTKKQTIFSIYCCAVLFYCGIVFIDAAGVGGWIHVGPNTGEDPGAISEVGGGSGSLGVVQTSDPHQTEYEKYKTSHSVGNSVFAGFILIIVTCIMIHACFDRDMIPSRVREIQSTYETMHREIRQRVERNIRTVHRSHTTRIQRVVRDSRSDVEAQESSVQEGTVVGTGNPRSSETLDPRLRETLIQKLHRIILSAEAFLYTPVSGGGGGEEQPPVGGQPPGGDEENPTSRE